MIGFILANWALKSGPKCKWEHWYEDTDVDFVDESDIEFEKGDFEPWPNPKQAAKDADGGHGLRQGNFNVCKEILDGLHDKLRQRRG